MEASGHTYNGSTIPPTGPNVWPAARSPVRIPPLEGSGLARLELMVGPVFDRLTAVDGRRTRPGSTA